MPSAERLTLSRAIRDQGIHAENDFIDDGSSRALILELAEQVPSGSFIKKYLNRTVLLAIAGQGETIAALIMLDGLARRVILWPQDRPVDQIASLADSAGVEEIVTAWPAEATSAERETPGAADGLNGDTEWVLFTSGTTGQPKMVVHSLQSLSGHIRPGLADGERRVWCTFYDMRRYGGLQIALRALVGGGSLVLSSRHESMPMFLARANQAGATHFLGTPSHWRLALMAGAHTAITPRYVRLSGEVADQSLLDTLSKAFPAAVLVHAFASTEAGLAFEVTDGRAGFPASLLQRPGTPRLRVRNGILQVCSERGARGILDREVAPITDSDGFIDTGDAVVSQGERFVFAGRQDGIVNVGGQKVFPEEVESIINQHPAVRMSRVSARRNAITGAVVSAEIVRHDLDAQSDALTLPAEIIRFCRERLPAHKVPVTVRLVQTLAVAASGKLVRLGA